VSRNISVCLICLLTLLFANPTTVAAEVTVPSILASHMICCHISRQPRKRRCGRVRPMEHLPAAGRSRWTLHAHHTGHQCDNAHHTGHQCDNAHQRSGRRSLGRLGTIQHGVSHGRVSKGHQPPEQRHFQCRHRNRRALSHHAALSCRARSSYLSNAGCRGVHLDCLHTAECRRFFRRCVFLRARSPLKPPSCLSSLLAPR